MTDIPTEMELIHGYYSLDEQTVVKNFLGKSAAEDYEMFCSDGNRSLAEDLMWMNVGGLQFYLPPAFLYLQSEHSKRDSTFASDLLSAFSFQLEDRKLPPRLILLIGAVVEYVRSNLSKFVVEEWDQNYLPDMKDQLEEIERHLKK